MVKYNISKYYSLQFKRKDLQKKTKICEGQKEEVAGNYEKIDGNKDTVTVLVTGSDHRDRYWVYQI